ncbi:hypothetical protein KR018_007356 [Drosophila ironensis]|nr:hypothetical protein KR018_007356 [Drosophila ironensis]
MNAENCDHYRRVKLELENETLLSFDDLVDLTNLNRPLLAKTLDALANERRFYDDPKDIQSRTPSKIKRPAPGYIFKARDLLSESGNKSDDMPSTYREKEKPKEVPTEGAEAPPKKTPKKAAKEAPKVVPTKVPKVVPTKVPKTGGQKLCSTLKSLTGSENASEAKLASAGDNCDEMMTFEEMVLLTRTHPLLLERSLRQIARQAKAACMQKKWFCF